MTICGIASVLEHAADDTGNSYAGILVEQLIEDAARDGALWFGPASELTSAFARSRVCKIEQRAAAASDNLLRFGQRPSGHVIRFESRPSLAFAIRHPLSEVVTFAVDSADDWRAVYLHHANVLLEGPDTAIAPIVRQLLPHLRQPIVSIRSRTAFALPTTEIGSLILDEVHTLTMQDQVRLLELLNVATRPQVISTSSQSLFLRVERGLFAEALYYRLNIIRLRIDSSNRWPLSPAI